MQPKPRALDFDLSRIQNYHYNTVFRINLNNGYFIYASLICTERMFRDRPSASKTDLFSHRNFLA